jgi:hypothetical protein
MSNLVWCVQLGIMIHFEMMFSDCDYSNAVKTTMETGFLDNVREEITHQVRRNSATLTIRRSRSGSATTRSLPTQARRGATMGAAAGRTYLWTRSWTLSLLRTVHVHSGPTHTAMAGLPVKKNGFCPVFFIKP